MTAEFLRDPFILLQLLPASEARRIEKSCMRLKLVRGRIIYRLDTEKQYSNRRRAKTADYPEKKLRELMLREARKAARGRWRLRGPLFGRTLRYTEYLKNGGFGWHVDAPHFKLLNPKCKTERLLTCILMLSGPKDFSGGDFELRDFFGCVHKIDFKAGQMLMIPSENQHRVRPIRRGTRRILVLWIRGLPLRQQEKRR